MKLEHYEMVTNAPIFNTITSLSASYAAQLASVAGRSTNKVIELGAPLWSTDAARRCIMFK